MKNGEIDEDEKIDDNNKNNPDVLAIQNIMRTEGGRTFIMCQLQACFVFESIFSKDPIVSSYNNGLRDAGLRLEREIKESAPEDYLKMIKENLLK